jgi:hypothetical protein
MVADCGFLDERYGEVRAGAISACSEKPKRSAATV